MDLFKSIFLVQFNESGRDGSPTRGPEFAMNFMKWTLTKNVVNFMNCLWASLKARLNFWHLCQKNGVDILSHARPDQDFSLSLERSWSGCGWPNIWIDLSLSLYPCSRQSYRLRRLPRKNQKFFEKLIEQLLVGNVGEISERRRVEGRPRLGAPPLQVAMREILPDFFFAMFLISFL